MSNRQHLHTTFTLQTIPDTIRLPVRRFNFTRDDSSRFARIVSNRQHLHTTFIIPDTIRLPVRLFNFTRDDSSRFARNVSNRQHLHTTFTLQTIPDTIRLPVRRFDFTRDDSTRLARIVSNGQHLHTPFTDEIVSHNLTSGDADRLRVNRVESSGTLDESTQFDAMFKERGRFILSLRLTT